MFSSGDRVRYHCDPEVPYGWPHLNGVCGTVVDVDDDNLIFVTFDYKAHLGALPCETSELIDC